MATWPQGHKSVVVSAADTQIKAAPGKVYGVCLSVDGATAADRIALQDTAAQDPAAAEAWSVILPAADLNPVMLDFGPAGIEFGNGIRWNPQITGAGVVIATVIYE